MCLKIKRFFCNIFKRLFFRKNLIQVLNEEHIEIIEFLNFLKYSIEIEKKYLSINLIDESIPFIKNHIKKEKRYLYPFIETDIDVNEYEEMIFKKLLEIKNLIYKEKWEETKKEYEEYKKNIINSIEFEEKVLFEKFKRMEK